MRRLIRLRTLIACTALVFTSCVFAQQPSIERQMTPEQFKAAGLEKLSTKELAQLNTWLNRMVETETAKAAVDAKRQIVDENRGFFTFGSDEPIVDRMVGEFRGFGKGRTYTLENGQVWQQVDDASLAGVRRDKPEVKITSSLIGNAWYLAIDGYNMRAKVQRVK